MVQPELEFTLVVPGETTPLPFKLVKGGILIPDGLTEAEWRSGLKLFNWAYNELDLGFAAYLAYGYKAFGKDKVENALAQLEFDMPNVTRAIDINTVPAEMRHPELTAEHYVILARADIKKPSKVKWAKIAAQQNLSPTQLKASINAGEVVSTAIARQQTHGILSIHGIRQEVDVWLRRVKGIEGILKMTPAEQQDILNLLAPIALLYQQLKAGMNKPIRRKIIKKR